MKFEIDIPFEEFDYYDEYDDVEGNHLESFVDVIIDRTTKMLYEKILKHCSRTINDKISESIDKSVKEISKELIKEDIKERIISNTVSRYERSKEYHSIKKQLEIESDYAINKEMKSLISSIVKEEVKKIIKL